MAKVVEVDGTGIRALSTADTLAEYRQRYQEAFGEDLAMEPETPQGQIIRHRLARPRSNGRILGAGRHGRVG